MKIKKFIITIVAILILAVITVTLIIFINATSSKPKPVKIVNKSTNIKVRSIKIAQYTPELKLYGKVESNNIINLTSPINANLAVLRHKEGSYLNKGELIYALDKEQSELGLKSALADIANIHSQIKLEKLRGGIDKAKQLHDAELVKLQSQLEQAEVNLTRAKINLKRSKIVAPADLYIIKTYVSPKQYLNAGNKILDYYLDDSLEIRTNIPKNVYDMWEGRNVATSTIKAKIKYQNRQEILKSVRAASIADSAGIDVFFKLPKSIKFKLYDSIELTLLLPPIDNAFLVEASSLYNNEYIYLVKDNALKKVFVQNHGWVNNNDGKFIVLSSPKIVDGDLVNITNLPSAIEGLNVKTQHINDEYIIDTKNLID